MKTAFLKELRKYIYNISWKGVRTRRNGGKCGWKTDLWFIKWGILNNNWVGTIMKGTYSEVFYALFSKISSDVVHEFTHFKYKRCNTPANSTKIPSKGNNRRVQRRRRQPGQLLSGAYMTCANTALKITVFDAITLVLFSFSPTPHNQTTAPSQFEPTACLWLILGNFFWPSICPSLLWCLSCREEIFKKECVQ